MRTITYRVTLEEPVLVASLEGDPNSARAFEYVPGSALRGLLIERYRRQQPGRQINAGDPDVQRLFFDGRTRYLNAYPLDRLNRRTVPTPLSWQSPKDKRDHQKYGSYALAVENPLSWQSPKDKRDQIHDLVFGEPDDSTKDWRAVGAPFCRVEPTDPDDEDGRDRPGRVRLASPDREIRVHTARTRWFGRAMPATSRQLGPRDDPGAVFRYDALAPGQSFEAAIVCDHNPDADVLLSLLRRDAGARLGGSRSGDYGSVRLEQVREAGAGWREVAGVAGSRGDGRLIVTLLSHSLVRDSHGQLAVDPRVVADVLGRRLGLAALRTPSLAFVAGEVVGGFNKKWGLPLPQGLAIRMGSVFVFEEVVPSESDRLIALETTGIGERRAEGFGRVAVNWTGGEKLAVSPDPDAAVSPSRPLAPGSPWHTLAADRAARLLRRRLDQKLVALTADDRYVIHNAPSNAQLTRLRGILRDELRAVEPTADRLEGYLEGVRQRGTARRQFERARVEGRPLASWIREVLRSDADVFWFNRLALRPGEDTARLAGVEATLTEALLREYRLRFLDAVLTAAAKKRSAAAG